MKTFPRDPHFDSTLSLARDPYRYISRTCRELGTDVFQTRLMLQKTLCLTGRNGAELILNPARFQRRGATPGRIQKTLFGKGGVQSLDGEDHRHRKLMMMSIMTPDQIDGLLKGTAAHWRESLRKWSSQNQIVFYDEIQEVLCRSVCEWAGVRVPESQIPQRTQQLMRLFDSAGNIGPQHWLARVARKRANRWIRGYIEQIRRRKIRVPDRSAAYVIAWHRDRQGQLLPARIAAVELLNVLRPVVAVSVFITHAAHALHLHPECRDSIIEGIEHSTEHFALEVRRFYPFFPLINALVRNDFEWQGFHFHKGTWVLFDLYGTNHDPQLWDQPEQFHPERFREWNGDPFGYVPQGGGDHYENHRCPGEFITIELIKLSARLLVTEMQYNVPEQNLNLDMNRLPALPESRFMMRNVQRLWASSQFPDPAEVSTYQNPE